MSKQPEIFYIDDDDDDDMDEINAEIIAATTNHNKINNTTHKIIQHDILTAAAVAVKEDPSSSTIKVENEERPSISVPTIRRRSPFRLKKHNNPKNKNGDDYCKPVHDKEQQQRIEYIDVDKITETKTEEKNNTNSNSVKKDTICNSFENVTSTCSMDGEEDGIDIDDDNDQEHQPITHLLQPDFERQFKSTILKPLHSILDSLKQDEILSVIRMHLFVIMQGIYLEARRIYVDQNIHLVKDENNDNFGTARKNNDLSSATRNTTTATNTATITSLIGKTNEEFDSGFFLDAPGLYIHGEYNVYGYNMSESTFVDPDVELMTKNKYLPQVVKMLLKLGEGGGDRKSTYGEGYNLSVLAEDIIACILLDFVGMVTKILSLVEIMEKKMNVDENSIESKIHYKHNGSHDEINNMRNGTNNEGMKSPSKKRRRMENSTNRLELNGTLSSTKSTKPLPNILDYLGEEILLVFTIILGSEACSAGYNQSLLNLRQKRSNLQPSVEDAVYLYLPPFFKSHLFDTNMSVNHGNDDDCIKQGNHINDDDLSALRTGEWRKYHCLYLSTDGSRDLHQDHNVSKNEERDAPPSNNVFISRHLIAMARFFVKARGLQYLYKIFLDDLHQENPIFAQIDLDILQLVISIFHTLTFISSYCIDNQNEHDDCLKEQANIHITKGFLNALQSILREKILRLHDFSQQDQRILLEIIGTLEKRSLTSMEYMRLQDSPPSLNFVMSPDLVFNTMKSHEMKLSALWKLLTGRNSGDDLMNASISAPSLQCQISALNEINNWIKNLENQVLDYREKYVKTSNDPENIMHPEISPEKNNNTKCSISQNGAGRAVVVSDEMPNLIHCENLNNEFLDEAKRDNDSTEVCCFSNDSISSSNSYQVEKISDINNLDENHQNEIVSKWDTLLCDLFHESENEFFVFLELLRSKYNVLKHLYSPNGIHTELLKRSLPLLDVFARYGKLKEDDLKMIWEITGFTAKAKDIEFHVHGSVISTIFDLLLGLINNSNAWMALGGDIIDHYAKLISEVSGDISRWSPQSLSLVETIAHRSIDLQTYMVLAGKDCDVDSVSMPAGFHTLWQLSQENCIKEKDSKSSINSDIALRALIRVIDSIMTKCRQSNTDVDHVNDGNKEQISQRESIILLKMYSVQSKIIIRTVDCIKDLSRSSTNTPNIRILCHILQRLPTAIKKDLGSNYAAKKLDSSLYLLSIEDLVNSNNLLQILIEEMEAYASMTQNQMITNETGNDEGRVFQNVSNIYTHKDCVYYRHQLFQVYVSRCFDITVSHKQTNTIPSATTKTKTICQDRIEDEFSKHSHLIEIKDPEKSDLQATGTSDDLFPTQNHISTLWKCFVMNEQNLAVVDCTFEMLYYLLTAKMLTTSTRILKWRKELASILYPMCIDLDSTSMSAIGYRLLVYCIGHLNAIQSKYLTVASKPNEEAMFQEDKIKMSNVLLGLSQNLETAPRCSSSFCLEGTTIIKEILDYNISGLEKLWSIVLESTYDDVANMAMNYIAVLYNFSHFHISQTFVEKSAEQVTFARHCISELKSGTKNRNRQKRLLHLMKLFVQYLLNTQENQVKFSHGSLSERINALEVESVIGFISPFSIFVKVVNGPKFTVQCPLGERTKVSFLRDFISRQIHQDFRLVFSGCELKQDSSTLATFQIRADTTVFCCPRLSTKHVKKSDTVHIVEPLKKDTSFDDNGLKGTTKAIDKEPHDLQLSLESKTYITPGISELLSEDCLKKLFIMLAAVEKHRQNDKFCQLKALVWELLQLLPTEPAVQDGIQRIFMATQEPGLLLEHYLPYPNVRSANNSSIFRMLYSLQVVERTFLQLNESLISNESEIPEKAVTNCKKRKNLEGEDGCIVIDPSHKASKKPFENRNSVVIIDDDIEEGDKNGKIQELNGDSNNNTEFESSQDVEPRKIVDNFVKNGGLGHVLQLFLSIDGSCFEAYPQNQIQSNHEISSLLVTCANKLLFLLINVTSLDEEYSRLALLSTETCSLVFHQLLKMIHWAVSFQLNSSTDESQASKYITCGWSSVEIGGALILHCLQFMKFITTRLSCANIPPTINIKHEVIANAMTSSIVYSPSNTVRSTSLPVFKQLLHLMEVEGLRKRQKTDVLNPKYFRLQHLSLLVSLLPVGRKIRPNTMLDQSTISMRCAILFEFVTNYITSAWSNLTCRLKQSALRMLLNSVQEISTECFLHETLCNPPQIDGIDQLHKLLIWTVLEIKFFSFNKSHDVDTYIEELVLMLENICIMFDSKELKNSIARLLVHHDETLLRLLFKSATFVQQKDKEHMKLYSTSPSLRKKLLDLVLTLCRESKENQCFLLQLLSTELYSASPRKDLINNWSIDPVVKQRGCSSHVGMKNQGATCYLNSLLQQFFHTPSFRSGLMSCNVNIDKSSNLSEEERLLVELQRLFGNLLLSEKRDFDTIDLVKTIRGYDGNTIRCGEQQDVDEFFNLFCTRLETALKDLPQKRLLHDVFGGQTSHIITCKECQRSSERIEDFLSISLDVKGKHNIFESLQAYIRGEVLDGANKYFCSYCKCKRDSIKRCCVKNLPNVLICHLKRFDFDLEQLRKIKVNDRFEYPIELNMKEYTKEGLKDSNENTIEWRDDSYYHYTLRGVVVHTGTADSGHYYSLSHVRGNDSAQADMQNRGGSWYCFNDSIVSPFDLKSLEITTFGGANDFNHRHIKRNELSKSYSAYLLIYDRVDQYRFDEQLVDHPKKSVTTPYKAISQSWENEIIAKNLRHAKDQIIFSGEYEYFHTELCKVALESADSTLHHKAIESMTYHLIDNIIHVRDRCTEIDKQFSLLMSWYKISTFSCRWLLQILSTSHKHWLEQILYHCYKAEIRIFFVELLEVIFQELCPTERETYYHGTNKEVPNNDAFDSDGDITVYSKSVDGVETREQKEILKRIEYWKSKSIVIRFIGIIIDLLDGCERYWRRCDQLFECLLKFAKCGHEESVFLIRSGLILRLIDIYQRGKVNVSPTLIIRPPNNDIEINDLSAEKKNKVGERDKRPNFLPLLQLFSTLIRSGNLRDEKDDDISDSDSSADDNQCVENEKIKCGNNSFLTENCLQAFCKTDSIYDLPKRDCYLASCKELVETMLNDVSIYNIHKDLEDYKRNLAITISQILCQICVNNLEKTKMVCVLAKRIIKDEKASESNIAVHVLSSLLLINDNHTHQRIQFITNAFFDGLSSNVEYEKELLLILEALHNQLARRSPGDRGTPSEVFYHSILLDNLEMFTSYFGRNITNTVKHKILSLIRSLLPTKKTTSDIEKRSSVSIKTVLSAYSGYDLNQKECNEINEKYEKGHYVDSETVKNKLFGALKDLHMSVADAINSHCNQTRNDYIITNGVLNNAQILESSKFSEYYATLRECLTGPKWSERLLCDDSWISTVTEYLMPTFWDVDNGGRSQTRSQADILKGEIIRFLERLAQLDPKQVTNAIINKQQSLSSTHPKAEEIPTIGSSDPATKMLEVFITTNSSYDYNNTYMVHFYGLLAILAENDDSFYSEVLAHNNWKWALKSFVLNADLAEKGQLYNVILRNTLKYVEDNDVFRKAIYKLISSSFLQNDTTNDAVLQLLSSIFDSEWMQSDDDDGKLYCISLFVSGSCGGMSKISSWTRDLFAKTSQENSENNLGTESLLRNLYHCINCTYTIVDALGAEGVNKLMKECWPEVDEMNSIVTQIITRTEDEWQICCKDNIHTKKVIAKIVSMSKELQQLLINASTNSHVKSH